MIKIVSILFLVIIFCSYSKAQVFQNTSFKVGYVSSNVSHSVDNETIENFSEPIGGLFLSISKEFLLSDLFSINPYLAYSQKGFNEKWIQTDESAIIVKEGFAKTKLDYLSLIFTATLKYNNPIIIPYVSIGPRFDFLLNKDSGTIDLSNASFKSFWVNEFSKWSYGATVIVGFEYKLTTNLDIILEGAYNPDFSNLLRSSPLNSFIKMKNNTFDIGIGIKL